MKVVIAIDSFKGCLSSMEAGNAVKEGLLAAIPEADVIVRPLADGGEGTSEALVAGLGGSFAEISVSGPLGERRPCRYGIIEGGSAVMEMASCAGLALVPPERRNPLDTTTFGFGEMILDAIERGCRDFIIGIGGSATNDGGLGMLSALGFRFEDFSGAPVGITGREMLRIARADISGADPRIRECRFRVACDVNNPLCGKNGAAHVYGPQKGASPADVELLDRGLASFSSVAASALGQSIDALPGTGAAGGLGWAFLNFLGGELRPGISIVLEKTDLAGYLCGADFFVTGEGKIDFQTSMGKAPVGAAALAKSLGAATIAFAGAVSAEAAACNASGIDAYFSIAPGPIELAEAMRPETARRNLSSAAKQVFLLLSAAR